MSGILNSMSGYIGGSTFVTGYHPAWNFNYPKFEYTEDSVAEVYINKEDHDEHFIYEIEFDSIEELQAKLKTYKLLDNL